jgi:8-oxo-dGTP pyrophosphatase MutT (NUDIX family)
MAQELWQLYDEQGNALPGKGATKKETGRGLLHAAAHVWMWRRHNNDIEILLQKRAQHKRTWAGLLDISAAGHIDLGETPLQTAVRETREEIGLDVAAADLQLFSVFRTKMAYGNIIENEFQWLYLVELGESDNFTLQANEVDAVLWQPLSIFKNSCLTDTYVPHGDLYYQLVIDAVERYSSDSIILSA